MPPSAQSAGEGRESGSVAPDGNQVGRRPADRLQTRALGVTQHRTRGRGEPAIKDAGGDKDIRAGIASAHLQRLVTVSRGEGADWTVGA
jgi:hypothetical protein